jgi:hypothetical protein
MSKRNIVNKKSNKSSSRSVLIKEINNKFDSLSDDKIIKIHNFAISDNNDDKQIIKVSKNKVIKTDKEDKSKNEDNQNIIKKRKVYQKKKKKPDGERKIEIAFHVINGIYRALEKDEINSLIDFNLWREDFSNKDVLEYLENEGYEYGLKEGMKKSACAWNKKNIIDHYSISYIKYLIKWAYDNKYEMFRKPCHRNTESVTSYIIVRNI